MAIAVVIDFAGGTAEKHDELVEAMGLTGQPASSVPGLIFHAAGPTETGWRVIDVWESEDDLTRFRNEQMMPAAMKIGGVPRPTVQVIPVHSMQR
jgi:hypothetical protein